MKRKLTHELVPQPVPLLQLGRRDDQTVDEGQKHRPEQLKVVRNTKIQSTKYKNGEMTNQLVKADVTSNVTSNATQTASNVDQMWTRLKFKFASRLDSPHR